MLAVEDEIEVGTFCLVLWSSKCWSTWVVSASHLKTGSRLDLALRLQFSNNCSRNLMKERPERTRTREESCFLLCCLSSALYWQHLTSCHLENKKYLKDPDPFSHIGQQRVNLVPKGNKLVTGIVRMVEIMVGKGEYKLLAQSFGWWNDRRKECCNFSSLDGKGKFEILVGFICELWSILILNFSFCIPFTLSSINVNNITYFSLLLKELATIYNQL